MAKKIVQPVEVQATVSGDQSVKSFKAQIREAQQEALRLAAAFGETDERTLAAAKRVAHLRDQMEDMNATIAGLSPNKFQTIARITGTLANGFAAAQGAAALLGSESEDLQKTMAKVQGAMALAQGLSGLDDLQFMLAGVKKTILTEVIPAFKTLGGALMATGIGALIVAIGSALVYFTGQSSKAREEGKKLRDELKKQEDAYKALREELTAQVSSGTIADEIQLLKQRLSGKIKTEEEFEIKRLEMLAEIYRDQAALEAAGSDERIAYVLAASDADLKIEKLKLEQQLEAQEKADEKAEENRKKRIEREQEEVRNSLIRTITMLELEDDSLAKREELTRLRFEQRKEELTKQGFTEVQMATMLADELKKVRDTYYKEQEDALKKQQDTLKAQREKAAQDELSFIQSKYDEEELAAMKAAKTQEDLQKAQTEIRKRELQNEIQARRDYGQATIEQEKELEAIRLANLKDAAEKEKTIEEAKKSVKEKIYADLMTASSAAIDIIGQETVAGKAIALAQIAADTGMAIAKALNVSQSPSPDNVASGGLAGLAKYAALSAAILSGSSRAIKIVKSGNIQQGAGGGGMSASRGSLPMPSMNSSSLGGGTQQAGQWSNKVYVTEGDISATQRRTRNLRKTSVL